MMRRFVTLFLLILPLHVFADDSSVIKPQTNLQRTCYRVQVGTQQLNTMQQDYPMGVAFTNCAWEGSRNKAGWGAAITAATYQQLCSAGKVATGASFGFRGQFLFGGGYDLWVYCCNIVLSQQMAQSWLQCP